jgi:hypothetical protein
MRFFQYVATGLPAFTLCAAVIALAPRAAAQTAAPPPPAGGAYAAPAAEPGAPPPVIRPYAWIKPTIIFAGSPIESFSQPNASAGTAAGNPVLSAVQDEASLTFQAAQSRLGFWFNEKGAVRGQFELDFIDFTKASPTTGALPRLRIAKVEWALTDHTTLIAGQDWDLFQPVNPYTLDIVAVAFQSGNSGFMRHQAKLIYKNDSVEVGAAVGLAAPNNGAKALVPEYSRIPTAAVRAALVVGGTGRVGIGAIGTSWRFAPDQPTERKAFAGAVGLYGDLVPFEHFSLRFEAYLGRNYANLGALSLGTGNAVNNLDEVGGFVSAKYNLTDSHALYMLAGTAHVLNDEDVVPSYTYGTVADGVIPLESTATVAGTGAGIAWNYTARLGYEYRYDKMIAVMAEGFMFKTKHVLNAVFDSDIDAERTALGAELGLLFTL